MDFLDIILATISAIAVPALMLLIWMYKNGVKDIKHEINLIRYEDIKEFRHQFEAHIKWHLSKEGK